jgi:hypothetical protein
LSAVASKIGFLGLREYSEASGLAGASGRRLVQLVLLLVGSETRIEEKWG